MELTILMPCLNEAETLAVCIRKARSFLAGSGECGGILSYTAASPPSAASRLNDVAF